MVDLTVAGNREQIGESLGKRLVGEGSCSGAQGRGAAIRADNLNHVVGAYNGHSHRGDRGLAAASTSFQFSNRRRGSHRELARAGTGEKGRRRALRRLVRDAVVMNDGAAVKRAVLALIPRAIPMPGRHRHGAPAFYCPAWIIDCWRVLATSDFTANRPVGQWRKGGAARAGSFLPC